MKSVMIRHWRSLVVAGSMIAAASIASGRGGTIIGNGQVQMTVARLVWRPAAGLVAEAAFDAVTLSDKATLGMSVFATNIDVQTALSTEAEAPPGAKPIAYGPLHGWAVDRIISVVPTPHPIVKTRFVLNNDCVPGQQLLITVQQAFFAGRGKDVASFLTNLSCDQGGL